MAAAEVVLSDKLPPVTFAEVDFGIKTQKLQRFLAILCTYLTLNELKCDLNDSQPVMCLYCINSCDGFVILRSKRDARTPVRKAKRCETHSLSR